MKRIIIIFLLVVCVTFIVAEDIPVYHWRNMNADPNRINATKTLPENWQSYLKQDWYSFFSDKELKNLSVEKKEAIKKLRIPNIPPEELDSLIAKIQRSEYETIPIPYGYIFHNASWMFSGVNGKKWQLWPGIFVEGSSIEVLIQRYIHWSINSKIIPDPRISYYEPKKNDTFTFTAKKGVSRNTLKDFLLTNNLQGLLQNQTILEDTYDTKRGPIVLYAWIVKDTVQCEDNPEKGKEYYSAFFADGLNGMSQCNNVIFGYNYVDMPKPKPVVVIEEKKPEPEKIVNIPPKTMVETIYSTTILEPECDRLKYKVWEWVSHSEDHLLNNRPDNIYNNIDGTHFYNIQYKNDKLFGQTPFTFIGGSGFKVRSNKLGILTEVYFENQETVLASKVNFTGELYCYADSLDREKSLQFGPQFRFSEYLQWKKNILVNLSPDSSLVEFQGKTITTTESGVYARYEYIKDLQKYNFCNISIAQMFREERSRARFGTFELNFVLKWETKVFSENNYLFLALNYSNFPKKEEQDSLFVPMRQYVSVEPRFGLRLGDDSPVILALGYREIQKQEQTVSTKIQNIDGYKYIRRDIRLILFVNPIFKTGWLEIISGHSYTKTTYETLKYLNFTDKHFWEIKATIGFSHDWLGKKSKTGE